MASSSRLGLVRCEHCNRQFNPHSAARHIPWCGNKQQSETRKPRLTSEKQQALDRYRWRISYRPTNYLGGGARQDPPAAARSKHSPSSNGAHFFGSGAHNGSSVFSSSASSASTSTSLGSQSNQHQHNHCVNANQQHRRQSQQQRQQRPAARLTRSVSSITLTRQQQQQRQRANSNNNRNNRRQPDAQSITSTASDFAGAGAHSQQPSRAKSHCDFTSISEIVDVLARRMDEIYAQNKRLLADLTSKSNAAASRPASRCDSNYGDADDDRVRCHHCRADCVLGANYCHNCGCKLHQPRAPATPDGEPVQVRAKTGDDDGGGASD